MVQSYRCVILFILLIFSHFSKGESSAFPVDLKTDHLENPVGIDNSNPRLTWKIEDSRKGAWQTAFRVIVSTDSLKAVHQEGDLWDSGKIDSDLQRITYNGDHLKPFTKYYWRVMVWDADQEKGLSGIHSFETGMMDVSNWQGD